jgi:hypothetical protein
MHKSEQIVLSGDLRVAGGICIRSPARGRPRIDSHSIKPNCRFVSLEPHVVLQGQATTSEQAIVAAGGSGVVIFLWFAFMLLRGSYPAGFLTDCASFLAGIEMLVWFVSSRVRTIAPPNNDVTKFITLSGADPALVAASVGAMALLAATCIRATARQHRSYAICCCVMQ